jgi:Holliday junction DNA helicase RuvA
MIARLTGILAETTADHAVLDVNGVGYLVQASTRTLAAIGAAGGNVMLFTEMQVREDAITLFGFGSAAERDWFRLLTGVQGVGGRVALAILSVLDPNELTRAIAGGDKAMIARAQGVGPKLAQRIAMELKDKVGGLTLTPGKALSPAPSGGAQTDALSALANLGFRPAEATAAVNAALDELGDDASLDALVRLALRKASKTAAR